MPNAIDLSGQRYGKLVAMRRAPRAGRRAYWRWKCDCGVEKDICADDVKAGHTVSCGCLKAERTAARWQALRAAKEQRARTGAIGRRRP